MTETAICVSFHEENDEQFCKLLFLFLSLSFLCSIFSTVFPLDLLWFVADDVS